MSTQTYLQQLRSWQQMLTDLQQENAMLKIKLSELVDKSVMADFLQKAEALHAELIINDESLLVLLNSVIHLSETTQGIDQQYPKINHVKIRNLQTDIRKYKARFTALTDRFHKEFSEVA